MGMFLFEDGVGLQGKSQDLSEIKEPSATLFVCEQDNVDYPCSVKSNSLFCLGLLESKSLIRTVKPTNELEFSSGQSKILGKVIGVECVVISTYTLDQIFEILDSDMALFIVENREYFDSNSYSIVNKYIPDDVVLECRFSMYNCSGSVSLISQDKEVTKIKLTFYISDTNTEIKYFFNENTYLTVGDNSWENFGDNFLDSYIDSGGIVDGNLLKKVLYNSTALFRFYKTVGLAPGIGRQYFNHDKSNLVPVSSPALLESSLYTNYHYYIVNSNDSLTHDGGNFPFSGQRLFMFYFDGNLVNASGKTTSIGYIMQIGGEIGTLGTSEGVGVFVNDSITDSIVNDISIRCSFGGLFFNGDVLNLILTDDNLKNKAERIILFDIKTETVYYYNITNNLFYSKTNGANNTSITFPNPGTQEFLTGDSISGNRANFYLYSLGYAIW